MTCDDVGRALILVAALVLAFSVAASGVLLATSARLTVAALRLYLDARRLPREGAPGARR